MTDLLGGMGSHQSAGSGEKIWLTPPWLIKALGRFDLDPCFSSPRPWDTADQHYGPDAAGGMGGLFAPWNGMVWCNPPYDQFAGQWLAKCAEHGHAIALIFARTETEAFAAHVWGKARGLLFLEGRLTFHHPSGRAARANGGAPSVLIAYGDAAFERLKAAPLKGQIIDLAVQRAASKADRPSAASRGSEHECSELANEWGKT